MPLHTVRSHLLRRVVAVLLTLCVLVTSAGWAHWACAAMTARGEGTAPSAGHVHAAGDYAASQTRGATVGAMLDAAPGQAGPGEAGGDVGHPTDRCGGHGCQSAPEEGGCAMMAHCATAVASSAAAVLGPALHGPTRPALAPAGRLLDRAYQPESPPPRA